MESVSAIQPKNRTFKYWYPVFLEEYIKNKDWAGGRAHLPLNIYLWDNEWTKEYDRRGPLLFVSIFNPMLDPANFEASGQIIDRYFRKDGQCIWVFKLHAIYMDAFCWFVRSRYNRMYSKSQVRWMYSPESITMLLSNTEPITAIMAQETKRILLDDPHRRMAYVSAINEEYDTDLKPDEFEVLDKNITFCEDEVLCTPGFGRVGCCGEEGVDNYHASMAFLKQYYDF